MTAISLRNLRVVHGRTVVIEGLDLDVAVGEFLVLLGPSGCGKTTLLHSIAGLVQPSAGQVFIGDADMTCAEPADRNIAMIFQSYALYPSMTVEQNLSFGLRARGVPRAEVAQRVGRAAAMLQIEQLLARKPAQLSGGQRQRVAIGRALVREAAVFLFDEPLSSLDAQLRADLRREIKLLHARLGSTVVYVTHDQVEAMTLATRIVVIRDGKVQQAGTPREIYDRPANRFVAGFVGSPTMNFLCGALECDASHARFSTPGMTFDVDACEFGTRREGSSRAVLGVRPEAVTIGPEGRWAGRVRLVEMLGMHQVVWVDVAGQSVAGLAPADTPITPGSEVRLDIDAGKVSLFDGDTGLRLQPRTFGGTLS